MKSKIEFKDAQIKLGDEFVSLGKVEFAEAITDDTEIPAETIGLDMTGFAFGDSQSLTMELKIENPLKLKLMLMGIPVVNIITCKNCSKRHTSRCPAWRSNFGDNDTCSKGELRI